MQGKYWEEQAWTDDSSVPTPQESKRLKNTGKNKQNVIYADVSINVKLT